MQPRVALRVVGKQVVGKHPTTRNNCHFGQWGSDLSQLWNCECPSGLRILPACRCRQSSHLSPNMLGSVL